MVMNPDNNGHCGPARPQAKPSPGNYKKSSCSATGFGLVGLFLGVMRVFMSSNDLNPPCSGKRDASRAV
jgi:hypothetical protein